MLFNVPAANCVSTVPWDPTPSLVEGLKDGKIDFSLEKIFVR